MWLIVEGVGGIYIMGDEDNKRNYVSEHGVMESGEESEIGQN